MLEPVILEETNQLTTQQNLQYIIKYYEVVTPSDWAEFVTTKIPLYFVKFIQY